MVVFLRGGRLSGARFDPLVTASFAGSGFRIAGIDDGGLGWRRLGLGRALLSKRDGFGFANAAGLSPAFGNTGLALGPIDPMTRDGLDARRTLGVEGSSAARRR